jgi:sortase A
MWTVVLIAGVILLACGIGLIAYNLAPDAAMSLGLVSPLDPYAAHTGDPSALHAAATRRPDGERVVIPRIRVDVQVYDGPEDRALARGVYHHAGTAEAGGSGNTVVAGHRNRHAFALLAHLRPGDSVTYWREGTRNEYRVARVFSVDGADAAILRQTNTSRLTLYTCTPRFLGNRRTVVVATPVDPETAPVEPAVGK